MIWLRRLPLKVRLTAGFTAAMALLLGVIAMVLYLVIGAVLLDEIDTGLRSRAATMDADFGGGFNLATPTGGLIESHEAFAQVIGPDGRVLESSPGVPTDLLPRAVVSRITRPTFFQRHVEGVQKEARLLAVPVNHGSTRYVIVVGSSMSDRSDALNLLTVFFSVGGPLALVVASVVGWLVAGAALRPVERMRQQASAISASGPDERLTLPDADDEIRRLAQTLNAMLERLDSAVRAERRFLDNASHELRTPLTALKAELDLARARPRNEAELRAALESASDEADRLALLAEDLLLLSRARAGRLPTRPEPTSLRDLLASSANLFRGRAVAAGIDIELYADDATVVLDRRRARQAIDNLLDNALRFGRHTIGLRGTSENGAVRITIDDDGPGFPDGFADRAFVAFERAAEHTPSQNGNDGTGLGLAIVKMIAESHGGTVSAGTADGGGARVVLTFPQKPTAAPIAST
jgi:signal transduction histidine kinase